LYFRQVAICHELSGCTSLPDEWQSKEHHIWLIAARVKGLFSILTALALILRCSDSVHGLGSTARERKESDIDVPSLLVTNIAPRSPEPLNAPEQPLGTYPPDTYDFKGSTAYVLVPDRNDLVIGAPAGEVRPGKILGHQRLRATNKPVRRVRDIIDDVVTRVGTAVLQNLLDSTLDLSACDSAVAGRAVADASNGFVDHLVVAVVGLDFASFGRDELLNHEVSRDDGVGGGIAVI